MASPSYREMKFYTEEQIKEITNDLENAITIPVNIDIRSQHRVYDFSEVMEILQSSNRYAVHECGCKTRHGNCDSPIDVCLAVNQYADEVLNQDNTNSKEITLDDAIAVIRRSHEAGLVPMAYTMKGDEAPFLICNCCPCCCHTLGSLVRNGLHTEILTSKFIAKDEDSLCNNCGECVKRCVFQARHIVDDHLSYDFNKCFGCGLCISSCPTGAIQLTPRSVQ